MFWRFGGYSSISAIDTLLDKSDVTLEEVLDESELMQELKQNNTKLVEYLQDDGILKRLLEYVISPSLVKDGQNEQDDQAETKQQQPPSDETLGSKDKTSPEHHGRKEPVEGNVNEEEDVDAVSLTADLSDADLENAEKARIRHAYVASEILSSNSYPIIEALIANEHLLRKLWRFLWREPPLDSLQSGYFTKVNEVLLENKPAEMLAFFRYLDGIVPTILKHVDNPIIMDLLLKIISLERISEGQGIVEVRWMHTCNPE